MNKLPWFTHDNDAHQDAKLRNIFRRHGGIARGFGLWWILIEVLDRHGTGDNVEIGWRDLEAITDCRRINLRPLICSLSAHGKLTICEDSATILRYEIKKFRERQSKMKSKLRSTFPQPSSNLPQDIEEEEDIEEDKSIRRLPATAARKDLKTNRNGNTTTDNIDPKKYFKQPIDLVMGAYKEALGMNPINPEWDRHNYKTWLRAGRKLLAAFGGNYDKAIKFVFETKERMENADKSWTLATAARRAWDECPVRTKN